MKTEDVQLLLIRHLKRNGENDGVLKRIVAKYYALRPSYIDKDTIFNCLFDLIEKYNLLPHPLRGENIRYFFIYKMSFEPDFENQWDKWIYRAKVCIRQSEVAKFPRYPEPAYFRNRHKIG